MRLLSPQTWFQENLAGKLIASYDKTELISPENQVMEFPYHGDSNLPLMYTDHRPEVGLSVHDVHNVCYSGALDDTMSMLDDHNHNLSRHQKELMLWHLRLGHAGFAWIQQLMRKRKQAHGDPPEPEVIATKTTNAFNCEHPICPACKLAKQHRRSVGAQKVLDKPEKEAALRRNDLHPGERMRKVGGL